jgi:hypothetical protein
MTRRHARPPVRLDAQACFALVRALRQRRDFQRAQEAKADAVNHSSGLWNAGARYAFDRAAREIIRAIRKQQCEDAAVRAVRAQYRQRRRRIA